MLPYFSILSLSALTAFLIYDSKYRKYDNAFIFLLLSSFSISKFSKYRDRARLVYLQRAISKPN